MDLSFAANVFAALGSEASLRLYRSIANARSGVPASEFTADDMLVLDQLQSLGLVSRSKGAVASLYEANQLLLIKALAAAVA